MNGSKLSHHTRVYVSLLPLKILISRLRFVHCYLPISHLCFKLTFSLFPSLDLLLDPSLPPVPLLNPPLFPLLPSQTNGAYNKLTKNSHAAKSVHFFLSVFFPFQCSYFFFFSLPPSGGKWVTGRRPVSSFIRWKPTCAIGAERLRLWDRGLGTRPLAACQGCCYMAIGLGGLSENEWAGCVYGELYAPWTSPSGQAGGLKSLGQTVGRQCAKRIHHKVRMTEIHWRRKASGRYMSKD